MGQEYFINSQELEDKIRQLLPSQGGAGAGVDLSASTQIIPIIDVTESAEGSNVRADLQTALSLKSVTFNSVFNTTTDLVTTTGYFRVFGCIVGNASGDAEIKVTDGVTTKNIYKTFGITGGFFDTPFDFVVFLEAGDTLQATTGSGSVLINVATRQIADIDGNLVNP
jgi:hypothetical protein|tara:strand:- start:229 stop:732 length:504 start_codon:yes stop_codon:yes gene_type:complete